MALSKVTRRGPWSAQEDKFLVHLVQAGGPLNWVKISQHLATRTPKQCRERYHQNLKPSLNHAPITPEEGALIERLVDQTGKRWAEIARRLDNRSDNAVKNWWNGSMNRRKRLMTRKSRPSPLEHRHSLYAAHIDDAGYARAPPPPPLSLPTGAHHQGYPHYEQAHPAWSRYSGLPSPVAGYQGGEMADRPPSLVSDSGSVYATSPKTALGPGSPYDLPPLRMGEVESPTTPSHPDLSPKPSGMMEQLRLPPIQGFVDGRPQLPTAPNSPIAIQTRHSAPRGYDMGREDKDSRMSMKNLVS